MFLFYLCTLFQTSIFCPKIQLSWEVLNLNFEPNLKEDFELKIT